MDHARNARRCPRRQDADIPVTPNDPSVLTFHTLKETERPRKKGVHKEKRPSQIGATSHNIQHIYKEGPTKAEDLMEWLNKTRSVVEYKRHNTESRQAGRAKYTPCTKCRMQAKVESDHPRLES
ncbi:hypothetical protein SESBI_39443 [Sesbania bispinosa]|nr:hypothetical protein SESBI_39443 [Sesbania bispinosa]